MHKLKPSLAMASAIALVGLTVAGPAASGAGADTKSIAVDVVFDSLGFEATASGRFSTFAGIPGGTFEVVDSVWDPPSVATDYRFDPAPAGGDTFVVHVDGTTEGRLPFGERQPFHAVLSWAIVPGTGTGVYGGLTGSGQALMISTRDWRTETYEGTVIRPDGPGPHRIPRSLLGCDELVKMARPSTTAC